MSRPLGTTSAQMAAVRLQSANKYIVRALLSIASAALFTRMMGMLTQVIVTSHFGAGAKMDAYFVASTFPMTLGYLLVSIVETSVIPVYARVRSQEGREQASRLFSTLLNLLFLVMAVLALLLCVFRKQVLFLTAPALHPTHLDAISNLTLFTYPVVVPLVVIGLLEAILNTEGQFGWPAYAGLVVPFCTGLFVLLLGHSQGVIALCIGTMVGLCLQLCSFVFRLHGSRISYRPVLQLRQPALKAIALAAWPVFLGSCISNMSPLIDQMFASSLSPGSISALSYALKLVSVFTGVLFSSIGRAVLPYLSRQAASGDMQTFKNTLRLYLWVVGLGTLALSMAVLLLAHPLVHLLFQRGAFTRADTERTATTLMGFMVGLTPMAMGIVTAKSFSALGRTKVLMGVSLFSVITNALLDAVFSHYWQCQGIALATSAYYLGTMLIMLLVLRRMLGKLDLLTVPPEFATGLKKMREAFYSRRWRSWAGDMLPDDGVAPLSQLALRYCLLVVVLLLGIYGVLQNSFYTLRIAIGSIGMVLLLRYPFMILMIWTTLSAVLSPNMPFLTNNNILTGLTIPTLLVVFSLPGLTILKRMPALSFFLLFLAWVFLGITITPTELPAFLVSWFTHLDYLVVAMITVAIVNTRQRLLRVIDAILLGATFIAGYGIYGYFTQQHGVIDPNTLLFRIYSIFSSAPSLALFLSVVLPLALFRSAISRGPGRLLALIVALLLLCALLLTFTRGAYLSVPLSLLLMLCLLLPARVTLRALPLVFVCVTVFYLLIHFSNLPLFGRFFNQDVGTLNGRTYLWQELMDHFDPAQMLGHGFGAANTLLMTQKVGFGGSVIATSVSNLYIGTLFDHGITGLALLLLLFVMLATSLWRGMRASSGQRKALFVVALAMLVNVVVQSLDLNDFWNQTIGLYFWIIAALPFAYYWGNRGGEVQL